MTGEAVLAVDVGTSSLKAVVFDARGDIRAQQVATYSTRHPEPGAAEQDPEDWWRALCGATRNLAPLPPLAGMVLTGSMQNLIAVDAGGRPLAPAILYSDGRIAVDQRRGWEVELPPDLARRIGNRPDNAQCVFRLLWCRDRGDPRGIDAGTLLFGAKDAILQRLTGRRVVDPTTGATTGLMELATRSWDPEILAAIGFAAKDLPEVVPGDAVVGAVGSAPAAEAGLPVGLAVVCGCGDAGAATWGAHAEVPGRAYAYLGTTGWVAATLAYKDAAPPRTTYTLAAPTGENVLVIAPFLTAGRALEWIVERVGLPLTDALEAAAAVDPSPGGCLFLPYLMGERSPFEDRDVRAAMLGIDGADGPGHLVYAVLEGLAHAIRHNLDALPPAQDALTVLGGGVESALQRQLIADVTGLSVATPPERRTGPAYGAFRLAARALGLAEAPDPGVDIVRPRSGRRERADRRYHAYCLASDFARTITPMLGQPRSR